MYGLINTKFLETLANVQWQKWIHDCLGNGGKNLREGLQRSMREVCIKFKKKKKRKWPIVQVNIVGTSWRWVLTWEVHKGASGSDASILYLYLESH